MGLTRYFKIGSRPINSVSLGHRTTCAFFTLEACVQPDASDPVLVVEGPAKLPKLPENFSSRGYVKAYLCGEEAKKFIGNGTDLGVIEVRGRGQEGKETRRDDAVSVFLFFPSPCAQSRSPISASSSPPLYM